MLTPQEITDKAFAKAVFGGYDMTEVDEFLESLSDDYSALYKENAILKGKLKVLVEKVEEYRSTEDAMRMALLTAQRMGEEITVEANKHKEETLRNTNYEVKAKLEEVKKRISDEEARLKVAAKETAKFLQLSHAIIQKHSEFLSKLETARLAISPDPDPSPPPLPTDEQHLDEVAEQIGSAVGALTASDEPNPINESPQENSAASTSIPTSKDIMDEFEQPSEVDDMDVESVSPRPKFDFDDLKFGANFDNRG